MGNRPANLATISWTIPCQPDVESRFGPTSGGDAAWAAMEVALDDAWIVRMDGLRAPAAVRDALDRTARLPGRYTKVHAHETMANSFWVWWAHDPAAETGRYGRARRARMADDGTED